ncbi:hypothetical protein BJP36_40890 [Moorena producens JHB]|uniref:Uncharacterized protein n=1 Tax=Moorena producens (strain JHB) TaxID=1454205 RepID=A0A9Q9SSC7_MOOP1|nr:hypothetical protein [Moorena producens]WAN68726.1 hypothetical protein BJP36_40890 [Moorena producens JHB]
MKVEGYRLQVTGYRLKVTGYRLSSEPTLREGQRPTTKPPTLHRTPKANNQLTFNLQPTNLQPSTN